MVYQSEQAGSRPARGEAGNRARAFGLYKGLAVGALVCAATAAGTVPAYAAGAGKVSFTLSGALSGKLGSLAGMVCELVSASPNLELTGNIKGAPGGAFSLEINDGGNAKGGTWTKFGSSTGVHVQFVDASTNLYWVVASGKLTTTPKSGSVDLKFVPDHAVGVKPGKGNFTMKGSWSC